MEFKDFKANEDKTFSILADGKEMRLIPETDLLSLKTANEERETKLKGDVSKAETLRNEEHANFLKLQATHEQIQTQLTETLPWKEKATQFETLHKELQATVKPLEDELANRVRENITIGWKVDPRKLEGKNLAELRQTETTLKIIGPLKGGSGYDIHGSGGSAAPANGKEAAIQEIAAARAVTPKI